MDTKELARICEAILFAAGEPVETQRLCFVTETDPEELRAVMKELMDLYAFERRGIRILRLEDSWQMCSQNDLAYDALSLIASARQRRVPFQWCRILSDLLCVLLAARFFVLAGKSFPEITAFIGPATLITATCMGPLIRFFSDRLPKYLPQESGSAEPETVGSTERLP